MRQKEEEGSKREKWISQEGDIRRMEYELRREGEDELYSA